VEADRQREPEPDVAPGKRALGSPWLVEIGARTAFITDSGYDPFDDDNAFTQLTIGAGRVLYGSRNISVAALGFWDYGKTTSSARGQHTELEVHRFTEGPEARLHLFRELYAFGRLCAGALYTVARLDESTTGTTLRSPSWTFAADATAGAAARFAHIGPWLSGASFWFVAEGGYGWATNSDLKLLPAKDDSTAPQRVATLSLGDGEVAVRGVLFRLAVRAAF
jgi:hypothetical protein